VGQGQSTILCFFIFQVHLYDFQCMSNLCLASAKYEAGLIIYVEDLFFEIFNLLLKSTVLAAAGPEDLRIYGPI